MAHPEVMEYEISVKVAGKQLEFLENKAKELGLSREELAKMYIEKSIDAEREAGKPKKKRISLEGITSGSTVTDADFEEVKKQWEPKLP